MSDPYTDQAKVLAALSAENGMLRAEVERLNRYAERLGANAERDANEIERLQAGLTDIASGTCSASGAAAIAKDVLRGKTREEWS